MEIFFILRSLAFIARGPLLGRGEEGCHSCSHENERCQLLLVSGLSERLLSLRIALTYHADVFTGPSGTRLTLLAMTAHRRPVSVSPA
ncbi:hypothetical protein LY78DRAFT_659522 [Colletotrichum sublineola]|nr:hypothetical protein LY78DRAFT_659522 [Colletotrichum sublineola]